MTQKIVRRWVMAFILVPLTLWMIAVEYYHIADVAIVLYATTLAFIGACLSFWVWWGFKSRQKPTDIFIVNGMLQFSIFIVISINLYARWLYTVDSPAYVEWIKDNYLWNYRIVFELLVFAWLLAWICGRVLGQPEKPLSAQEIVSSCEPKILLVEDDMDLSNTMKCALVKICSFQVDQAYNTEDALEFFSPNKYSCVILDLNLGNSINDGIDLAYAFRNRDENVFLAIVSGYFEDVKNLPLMDVIDDFVRKPFDIDFLQLKSLLWVLKYNRRIRNINPINGLDWK